MKHKKINLDADTGQIVSDEFAAANKEKVVAVRRMHKLTKIFDEARLGKDPKQRLEKLNEADKTLLFEILSEITFALTVKNETNN